MVTNIPRRRGRILPAVAYKDELFTIDRHNVQVISSSAAPRRLSGCAFRLKMGADIKFSKQSSLDLIKHTLAAKNIKQFFKFPSSVPLTRPCDVAGGRITGIRGWICD